MNELAEKMVAYRAKHNITQFKLAELCKLSEATIIHAEQGKRLAPLSKAKIEHVINEEGE